MTWDLPGRTTDGLLSMAYMHSFKTPSQHCQCGLPNTYRRWLRWKISGIRQLMWRSSIRTPWFSPFKVPIRVWSRWWLRAIKTWSQRKFSYDQIPFLTWSFLPQSGLLRWTAGHSRPSLEQLMTFGFTEEVLATARTPLLDRWSQSNISSNKTGNLLVLWVSINLFLLSTFELKPRWLVLAFGQDEEIGGHMGAALVNQHLLGLYGEGGIAMIVDEGGSGVDDTQFGRTFTLPGVVEKGSIVSIEVSAKTTLPLIRLYTEHQSRSGYGRWTVSVTWT